jgi:glutamate/aspartate transport system substrate-binding protein
MRRLLVLVAAAFPVVAQAQPTDKTLQHIRDSKAITIGYRTDAPPFSYDAQGQPAGYSVELCKRVVASLEQQLKVQPIAIKWVPANVQTRLDVIRTGQVDMECGTTTITLSRMDQVDFSNPVWVDATGLLVRKSVGARNLGGLSGKSIAVVAGTPNERALQEALKKGLVNAKVVSVKSYDEAVSALELGGVDALAAGKMMLAGMAVSKIKDPAVYELLDEDIGYVPYAIVLPLGAIGLRPAVNRALSQIYGSDAIVDVFRSTFGPGAKLSLPLAIMYRLNTYPE